ncbi:MAG TPA: dTDP-4-dehydrorhamnose reductase [Gammaproteobacteria bacterium]|jgi:dTDP-4-dehydrorhamnose reductase|nr:dTDP-4-dehydrorhamnose reductase [Gammaproteobacteria bacterium]
MPNYSPRILITGGRGQLANALANHPLAKQFTLNICSHDELDITHPDSIQEALDKHVPDIVINTAAYTAVDRAEHEAGGADLVNHIGAGHVGLLCKKNQIKLLHISTDYIFDGNNKEKYLEDDTACPVNIYGKSKWEGEQAIRSSCENHIILRVSGIFSEYGNNFLKTMLKLARERSVLRVVNDQITCPTSADDIASAIYIICNNPSFQGTLHYCSSESVSWFDFAKAIIEEAREHEQLAADEIKPISAAEYITDAKRPAHSVLDCSKIKKTYQIEQPSWRNAICQIIPKLIEEQA